MLLSILLGSVLVVVTVVLHAAGLIWWMRRIAPNRAAIAGVSPRRAIWVLAMTTLILVVLHVIPVLLWAVTYYFAPEITGLETFEESVYFSFVTYTTLGYGDVVVHGPRRLMTGIEALNGILLAGLSTAILVAIGQRVLEINTAKRA